MRKVSIILVLIMLSIVGSNVYGDLLIVTIKESELPFDLSPSNYDNSPSNYDNSVSNYNNSPSNYNNSPTNYENSSSNYKNGKNGDRRLLVEEGSSHFFVGYYVMNDNGVTNYFSVAGKRLFYTPAKASGVFHGGKGFFCGVLAKPRFKNELRLMLTEQGQKVLFAEANRSAKRTTSSRRNIINRPASQPEQKTSIDSLIPKNEQLIMGISKLTALEKEALGMKIRSLIAAAIRASKESTASPRISSISTSASTIIGKDSAEMVLIPAGSFKMGSSDGYDPEKPVHTVYVDAFYMDKYEVANAQYRKFMQATGHREPDYWDDSRFNQPNQPVVGVNWNDAVAYARWAGKRLPTEAEWEYAARGGLEGRKYPWGDTIDSSKALYHQDSSTVKSVSVGSYSSNGYGLYDMAGNVWEWCADWYGSDYYSKSSSRNPQGPSSGSTRVLRGGSWYNVTVSLRVAGRNFFNPASTNYDGLGFRCVSGF